MVYDARVIPHWGYQHGKRARRMMSASEHGGWRRRREKRMTRLGDNRRALRHQRRAQRHTPRPARRLRPPRPAPAAPPVAE
eukprot:2422336-Pleurochrysis_carterae.AAC.2